MKHPYLLDAGPAADFLFDRAGVRPRMLALKRSGVTFGIGLPTLGELIHGIEGSDNRDRAWETVHRSIGRLIQWPFDEAAAYAFGRIAADLKMRGRLIQQIDMQIAGIAMTKPNCTLVTYDSDFDVVPGLNHENWLV